MNVPSVAADGQAAGGHLAENMARFVRLLRDAGLPLGPGSALDAARAAAAVDVMQRDELYWALHAVLVHRREERELFAQAFALYFREPRGNDDLLAALLSHSRIAPAPRRSEISRRLAEAWRRTPPLVSPERRRATVEFAESYADEERLRSKDFAQMSASELRRVRRLIGGMRLLLREEPTRRLRPDDHGPRLDLRRMLRASLRLFGDATPLRRRGPAERPPPLVALCDISGSMDRYAQVLLPFLHALGSARQRVHCFVFGTRLSNITRALRQRDVDLALRRVGQDVRDWSGGTRIRACLREFNLRWSRRVLGQGAIVLLITDGLDQDPEEGLSAEAARLRRSCRRLIWLNPLLRYEGFEPRARGVKALLPHVDDHRPVHNLDSLEALARALQG